MNFEECYARFSSGLFSTASGILNGRVRLQWSAARAQGDDPERREVGYSGHFNFTR